jgi:hypothetical protein
MLNRVDIYSAMGVLRKDKPFKIAKVEKWIARGHARWITPGVSAQLLYWTDEELEAERMRLYQRDCADRSDEVVHLGEWRVVQPPPNVPLPSGWQLQHPKIDNTQVFGVETA